MVDMGQITLEEASISLAILPAELLHSVCDNLEVPDIKSLRFVNKTFGEIGFEHLLPSLSFHLSPTSFGRLQALTEHSTLAKYVKQLNFNGECWTFPSDHWSSILPMILDPFAAKLREMVNDDGSFVFEGKWDTIAQMYASTVDDSFATQYRNKTLKSADMHAYVEAHRDLVAWQGRMWADELDVTTIARSIQAMPALIAIKLSPSISERQALYLGADKRLSSMPGTPAGVRQLNALLLGCFHAGTRLKSLEVLAVSWRLFAQEETLLKKLTSPLSKLTTLKLCLTTTPLQETLDFRSLDSLAEAAECRNFLHKGSLRLFLCNMLNLRELHLSVSYGWDYLPLSLEHAIGDTHWPKLETLTLRNIATREDSLTAFLRNHMSTLKELDLGSMLLSYGTWLSAFVEIRELVSTYGLNDLRVGGWRLERWTVKGDNSFVVAVACNGESYDNFDPRGAGADENKRLPLLEAYLRHGGQCPMRSDVRKLMNIHYLP
ncbi:hypothetical protein BU16DRAFT_362044 [Lophium mytilinum]|uniref:F-box domain-containing protein n=1 Tax=Lophium mytilinum TaxID=390894 RepID=A0A6A6QU82_9PEZI|nr:hypothetical protein BU16DRAFT_362044 [Lophium mytilinum]